MAEKLWLRLWKAMNEAKIVAWWLTQDIRTTGEAKRILGEIRIMAERLEDLILSGEHAHAGNT